jgi:hypothetical protein
MYSFYVLRDARMVNNNDTVADLYVLSDRNDLLHVLEGLELDLGLTEACRLDVYLGGRLEHTVDLLATVPDEEVDDDDVVVRTLDLAGLTIPMLEGDVLPPGHPVVVDDETLHYGCTSFYN